MASSALTRADAATAALQEVAAGIRSFVLHANRHPGGASSAAEAVAALYFNPRARLRCEWRGRADRDKVVYSKGHAWAPQVAALWLHRWLDVGVQTLLTFGEPDNPIPRMPRRDIARGLEMSTGALGQGVSFGVGLAIADRKRRSGASTYVVVGDGECTEGQIWEAAHTAGYLELSNLVVVLDANGSGSVVPLDRSAWRDRWASFGWAATDIDGHDVSAILEALHAPRDRPLALVLHTVKGRGLPSEWEGSNKLSAAVPADAVPAGDFADEAPALLALADELIEAMPVPDGPCDDAGDAQFRFSGVPLGAAENAKLVCREAAKTASQDVVFFLSPDAIRNSGLQPHMDQHGSWSFANPNSNVLQLAISEQDCGSIAGGLASAGLRPVVVFMEGFFWRMLDAIRESICFPSLPVVMIGTSGGISDPLGPMVQSDGCLRALLALGDLEIVEAADMNESGYLLERALEHDAPSYLRLPHESAPAERSIEELRRDGDADGFWLRRDPPGARASIVCAGSLTEAALAAADELATERIATRVVQVYGHTTLRRRFAFPAAETLTPSDHPTLVLHNAPGSVLGELVGRGRRAVLAVDSYGEAGPSLPALLSRAHLTAEDAVSAVRALVSTARD